LAIREKIYYRRVMTYNYDKLYSETPDALARIIHQTRVISTWRAGLAGLTAAF
jgi:hypothetical protein